MDRASLVDRGVSVEQTPVDFSNVQGLLRFGYGRLTEASFLLVRIRDVAAAKEWLVSAPVSNAVECEQAPETALQIAFGREGLERLGLRGDAMSGFSLEFQTGMAGTSGRSRLLGDVGASDPARWMWGGPHGEPHMLVLLYAQPGQLAAWLAKVKGESWNRAFDVVASLPTTSLGGREPFGFMDGISQPMVDWKRALASTQEQATYSNVTSLGEFVLGYPNEYGHYTDRPLLPIGDGSQEGLPLAADVPAMLDLGRDGCYLVLRSLEQDVGGFWRFVDERAGPAPGSREALAEAMVGRRLDGTPLVSVSADAIPGVEAKTAELNQFTFDGDAQGLRCPFGAHIRRANPRNADLPTPPASGLERLLRTVGLGQRDLHSDAKASTRFHRILRRGREYGPRLSMKDALAAGEDGAERGIHFVALVGNIARQFEFLQSAWLMSTKFDALADESDPLVGNREPSPGCARTDTFSRPHESGVAERVNGLPAFVRVTGGAYFFLPSLAMIRYLAAL